MTLQLSGQGCREMELILESIDLSWQEFLQALLFDLTNSRVTRLDIAMDERYLGLNRENEHFLLLDMIAKVYKDEVEGSQGISLYFGSRQSNLYFNFYEKRYELAKNEQISVEQSLEIFCIWNRYELRFAQEKAQLAI